MVTITVTKVVKKTEKRRTNLTFLGMKARNRIGTIKVPKARAIQIAMNHNGVPRQVAENYSDSELREVLAHLKLKAGF